MRLPRLSTFATAAVLCLTSLSAQAQGRAVESFIFVFDSTVAAGDVEARAVAMTRGQGGSVGHVYRTALRGFSATMPAEAAARMAARNPMIAYYERDGVATAFEPGGPKQDNGAEAQAQTVPWGISRVGGPVGAAGMVAWIIDSGIDLDHPDLHVDLDRSANFVSRGKNSPDDGNGHGTHVAGTVAALNNGDGVVGVAADATVVAVRVLGNSGRGSYSDVIAGIDYVAASAAPGDVANMSLGGPPSNAVDDAVRGAANAGVLFSLAAGNSGADANGFSPARVNHPNVYTVSAIDSSDVFAWFSNFGNPPVDCAAPGVNVLSTAKGGGTTTKSGTSMAAPHVAGLLLVAGLLVGSDGLAVNDPDGTPDVICHF